LSLGISRNEISKLLKTSRNTIRKVENTAKSLNLTWNDASTMSNEEFANKLFPKSNDDNDNLQPKPDCEMMYLELLNYLFFIKYYEIDYNYYSR
jgi:predicted transcriptional regulator